MGKSDPYAVLTVGARSAKTERINNTVNPEWNFIADFPIEVVKGQELVLEIMDHDDPGDDEFLGWILKKKIEKNMQGLAKYLLYCSNFVTDLKTLHNN